MQSFALMSVINVNSLYFLRMGFRIRLRGFI